MLNQNFGRNRIEIEIEIEITNTENFRSLIATSSLTPNELNKNTWQMVVKAKGQASVHFYTKKVIVFYIQIQANFRKKYNENVI